MSLEAVESAHPCVWKEPPHMVPIHTSAPAPMFGEHDVAQACPVLWQ